MKLSKTDKFEAWMANATVPDLLEMLQHLEDDMKELWRPGSLGSFMRNRYEIHDDNAMRQRAIRSELHRRGWTLK